VTQDNQGKKTAGIDGLASLPPKARLQLAQRLRLGNKASPMRRVYIPKPGSKTEQRPLSIPTMHDRALQVLVKLALEPEWEAHLDLNNYGYRPGRSCRDAIGAIFLAIKQKQHKGLNNRAENSHQPTRVRERRTQRFNSPGQAQRFLSAFGPIRDHFHPKQHQLPATRYRQELRQRFQDW
jgi:hypothetical protein